MACVYDVLILNQAWLFREHLGTYYNLGQWKKQLVKTSGNQEGTGSEAMNTTLKEEKGLG